MKNAEWMIKNGMRFSSEIPEIWQDLLKKRAYAIAVESARENFVTKHCNIVYQGTGTETYIDVKDVQACKVANIDWAGRVVYLGLDLSETNDNTSVSMVSVDEDNNIGRNIVYYSKNKSVAIEIYSEKSVNPENLITKWLDMKHKKTNCEGCGAKMDEEEKK